LLRFLYIMAVLVSAPACTGAQPKASNEGIQEQMLVAHNSLRKSAGVPPLTWSNHLASVAQEWASTLVKTGKFAHRPKNKYGENIFEARGYHASPSEVVGEWAAEAKDYDRAKNTCRAGAVCGHYTQLVWRSTRQVGCGVARGGGREVWVCNYDPPGNWIGERPF
jgi:uncharacterized protein YkwD